MVIVLDKKRSIGEAAKEMDVPEYVLRFWEKEFCNVIKPTIGVGNRRYYYDNDIKILLIIKKYLYKDGYTIKGLKNLIENDQIEFTSDYTTLIKNNYNNSKERIEKSSISNDKNNVNKKIFKQDLINFKQKLSNFYEKLKNI